MFSQENAIVRLLSDDDPNTVNLVKEQLASKGEEAVGDLKTLLGVGNENVRRHVREVLAEIDANQAIDEISILCPFFYEDASIEHASWLLARALLPGTDVERYRRILDQYGHELALLLDGTVTPDERIIVLADYLGKRHEFRGNTDDYYDAGNSLLPRIIDSRLGIPISLTLLYMLVGARAGMKIEGVNLPGHFLARHGDILFDPFERGRIVKLADCNEILARQNLTFSPEHLEVATPRIMFRRMLGNLLTIFQNDGEAAKAEHLAKWIHLLERA